MRWGSSFVVCWFVIAGTPHVAGAPVDSFASYALGKNPGNPVGQPLRPMRIVSVTTEQPVLPVLVGNVINPIIRVRIVTEGSLKPIAVTGVRWTLSSEAGLREIAGATAYVGTSPALESRRPNECFGVKDMLGRSKVRGPSIQMTGSRQLVQGDNYLWLSVSLSEETGIDGWIDAECVGVAFSNGRKIVPTITDPHGVQRFGVAVRNAGDDGVAVCRIPGVITTKRGTVVAVYDIRHGGWGDLPGNIDVGASRSTDGGTTWEPMRIIMDMGDDPRWNYDGVGDPAVLYDKSTDTIWVAGTWSHGNRSWTGSGPGLKPMETGQLLLVKSSDDGQNWSDPINITGQIKDPQWAFVLQSPGRGTVLCDNTLVFPAQYQTHPDDGRVPHATIIYSRDQGKTWKIGRGAKPNTTESRVVELEPGTLMLNIRDNRGGSRAVYVTRDLGNTWKLHPSSRGALREPVCNAGLIRVRAGADPRHPWLAFVNPNVARSPRRRITLKLSTDGGLTWPTSRHLLLDEGRSAGYASLTMIDENTIGVLYEGSRAHLTFQRIPLRALLGDD